MPVTVQGPDNLTYQFPDGTDKAGAVSYFRRKGIGAAPDFSSNSSGEGLYPMKGPNGTTQVPFSKVKDAISSGYSLDPKFTAKYHDDLRATQPPWYSPGPGNGVGEFLKGGAASIINTVEHPEGILQPAIDALPTYRMVNGVPLPFPNVQGMQNQIEQVKSEVKHPAYAAGGIVLPMALTAGIAKGFDAVPSLSRGAAEGISGTSPRVTEELVDKTQAQNAKIEDVNARRAATDAKRATRIQGENADTLRIAKEKAANDRAEQLRDYLRKKQNVTEENSARQSVADRKVALERGVEHLDPELKGELEKTEEAVNATANQKYNDLVSVLKDEQASPYQPKDAEGHIHGDPQTITEHLYDIASEPLRGTETESSIIKSLGKRVETGETSLTYNDLQGYREEVGKELRKGTLPPDTFTAYKNLMPAIDEAMQEIADRHGLGKAQTDARNYYRGYAQSFIDRTSPIRKALDATERGGSTKALLGKDQSGIETLARYNPELARRFNTVRGYMKDASAIKPVTARKPVPEVPQKPNWVPPKEKPVPEPHTPTPTKKLGESDIQAAKEKSLHDTAKRIRQRGMSISIYVTGYRSLAAVGRAMMGDVGALRELPGAVAEGIGTMGGASAFARILESPKVIELLTKPTARDLAQIPPELRANLEPIVEQAKAHGVKVSPLLIAAIGGLHSGPKAKELQALRDKLRPVAFQ